ncbi:MAG TPA: outer membrane lipoprotein carrier protein LolA [Syntrophobacter fumaroxidans]|nr:outer membrane lipoprotein carrier protein LolA [Syntrophobacter fumaroxidans]
MRAMKNFHISCGLFLFLMLASMWCGTARANQAALLSDILKKTEANYQKIQAFTANFHQSTTSAAASTMTTTQASGKLFYEKPRQMRWEYEKPEPQVFVANRDLAWLYVPADKQISLFDAKTLFASPLAQTFFDGMVELKKHFQVSLDPKQSSKATAVLRLVPKQEDPNIKALFLRIDLQTYKIITIESHDALGNANRIMLDSQNSVPQLDRKLFELDTPPGITATDMDGRELSPAEIDNLKQKLQSK